MSAHGPSGTLTPERSAETRPVSHPRFEVTDAPGAGGTPFGFVRAVIRRALSKLPLALLLLAMTNVIFRIEHLHQTALGSIRFRITDDAWKAALLSQGIFVGCIVLAVVAADEAVARGARRWSAYGLAVIGGAGIAAWAQARAIAWIGWVSVVGIPSYITDMRPLQLFFYAVLYATFGTSVYVNLRTARLAAARLREAELARAVSRRRTLESQLQAMQARVEPQFLFNTLAHVRDLFERDPAAAGRMLDDLIAYLRAALPHLRESSSTLGREIELARAYLDIVRARLHDAPAIEIDVPEALRSSRVPAMTLLPLVEHVLAHRQCTRAAGGSIRIGGTHAARLRISLSDSGAAFAPGESGDRVAGIGERLRALYGAEASFGLERSREGGTSAFLEIPHEDTDLRDR
jgi:hypothetical protein